MELVDQNPSVLSVTDSPDILDMLVKSKNTIVRIHQGLNNYLKKTRLIFPRFKFNIVLKLENHPNTPRFKFEIRST